VLPISAKAAPGDELVITGFIVNLRAQPSKDAAVLLKLKEDITVVEIQREGDWVQVYNEHAGVPTGWVHNSLIVPVSTSNTTAIINHTEAYNRFMTAYNKLSESWKQIHGVLPFVTVAEYINRKIRITAKTEWLQAERTEREQMVADLFKIWSQIIEPGLTAEIEIVDTNGNKLMSMFR
jgi:hypothetical protein